MNLPLHLDANKAIDDTQAWKEAVEDRLLGHAVKIEFTLPDGVTEKMAFRSGHTVERLKAHIEVAHNIPYHLQEMYLGERRLADPLSLSDYKLNSEDIYRITVKQLDPNARPADDDD